MLVMYVDYNNYFHFSDYKILYTRKGGRGWHNVPVLAMSPNVTWYCERPFVECKSNAIVMILFCDIDENFNKYSGADAAVLKSDPVI